MTDNGKVLIIDDDTHMCSGLQELLVQAGYAVNMASTGEQATQILKREAFDIVLVDIVMPDSDGFELIDERGFLNEEAEIIVITGYASIDSAVQALRKGAYDYIRKPFEPDELLNTVKNALHQKNLQKAKRQTEQRLKESEGRYRSFIDNYRGIAYQGSLQDIPDFFHGAVETLTGYTSNEFLSGQVSWQQLVHPNDLSIFCGGGQTAAPPSDSISFEKEYRIVRRDGRIRWVHEIRQQVHSDSVGSLSPQGFLDDVTVRKSLEEQYHNAQKIEAISTLAGGIAHQFNNALIGITGNIELLTLCCHDNRALQKYVVPMLNAAKGMSRLTKQLLAYARGGKYNPTVVNLNQLIVDTVAAVRHSLDDSIRIQTDLAANLPETRLDVTQIQMVLSALINNAAEAIEGGGLIRIHTETCMPDQIDATDVPNCQTDPYVCLTVTDDGKGMTEDTKSRIFDPFYSTKFQGRGLGLAASYGIIKNHGGWITIDSTLGKGTAMGIYLPGLETREPAPSAPTAAAGNGSETILVVDDEIAVMDVYCEMLDHLGYRVLVARSGQEAIDLLKHQPETIDLVILDIGLPDLRGDMVYRRLREIRRNLKIIISTGYAVDQVAHSLNLGSDQIIQKPYDLLTLSSRIRNVLKGK